MQFASPLWNFDPLHSLWGLRCISRRIQFHSYNNSTGSTRFGWNTDGDTNLDFLCFRQIILIGAIIHPVITTLNLPSLYSFAAYTASNTLPSLSQPNGSCGSATLASGDGVDRHFGMERFRCRYYSDVSHCAYSFLSLFALRPLSSPESSFRPVTGPAIA